jgi:chemotaxis protein MotB
MASRPRRERHDTHENHDRWLVSYADFVTLLLAFFVVMYAISSVNDSKYKAVSASLDAAFKMPQAGVADPSLIHATGQDSPLKALTDKRDARQLELQKKRDEAMKTLAGNLARVLASFIKADQVNITRNEKGILLDIRANALFDEGESDLQPGSAPILVAVAKVLGGVNLQVEVDGHTDSTPIANSRFSSNWELSAMRACDVVRLFVENGIAPERLTAAGMASYRPVADNDTAEGRARNRRVTVMVLAPPLGD